MSSIVNDNNNDRKTIKEGSMVTAIYSFNGARSQKDLNFERGDIMKIMWIVQDDPQWAYADVNGKQGFIPTNYVKPIPYFYGKITREQAEFLLKDKSEGTYLIRESTHYPGDCTLCLKTDKKIEHYHIKRSNGICTIDDEAMFPDFIKLVYFYSRTPDLACLLKKPLHIEKKVEIDDYQSLIRCNSSIIEIEAIKFGKQIGTGEFGAVYKGEYDSKDVAIKTVKDLTTIKEFIKEAAVMATLHHQNLVKLIGVVFNNDHTEMYLVTEYMPKGNLLDYLTSRGRNVLTKKELIQFAVHICEGMAYLEEKGIVHRDLAASNVLISEDNIAKVSDFGLAKKIMDESKTNVRIRIKWTAPEAIKGKHYSNKSDMWSFGILLWEIFSYGRVPYPKITVNEVLLYVEQGNRMEKPEGCPDEIYNLMIKAWQLEPTIRPSFKDTLIKLKESLDYKL